MGPFKQGTFNIISFQKVIAAYAWQKAWIVLIFLKWHQIKLFMSLPIVTILYCNCGVPTRSLVAVTAEYASFAFAAFSVVLIVLVMSPDHCSPQ